MFPNRPITDYLALRRPVFSVEFFPPKNEEGGRQILQTAEDMRSIFRPDFVSITYGAGGSTRERTLRYARILKEEYRFQVMPHLTCVGSSREELIEIVRGYQAEGFCNIMALRGDPPKGAQQFTPHPDGLRHARELVDLIRGHFAGFSIGVAGYPERHPESPSAEDDLRFLKEKCEAGASFITTQLYFDNRHYFAFVERCRAAGLHLPIIPGLLPPLSLAQIKRFSAMGNSSIPALLEQRLTEAGDDAQAGEEAGLDWTATQIAELIARGAPGVHLYILNRSGPALALLQRLKKSGVI